MIYSERLHLQQVLRHHYLLTCFIEQIQRLQKSSSIEHEFTVVWVPRRTLVSDKILEESGVLGDLSVEVLPLYFIPLELDVLSLCLEESFGDIYLVGILKTAQRSNSTQ